MRMRNCDLKRVVMFLVAMVMVVMCGMTSVKAEEVECPENWFWGRGLDNEYHVWSVDSDGIHMIKGLSYEQKRVLCLKQFGATDAETYDEKIGESDETIDVLPDWTIQFNEDDELEIFIYSRLKTGINPLYITDKIPTNVAIAYYDARYGEGSYAHDTDPYIELDEDMAYEQKKCIESCVHKGDGIWNNGEDAKFGYHIEPEHPENNFRIVEVAKKGLKSYRKDEETGEYVGSGHWFPKGCWIALSTPNPTCKLEGEYIPVILSADKEKDWEKYGIAYVKNEKGCFRDAKEVSSSWSTIYTTCKTSLYDAPNGKKIAALKQNTKLTITGTTRYKFYKVNYNGKTGYVKTGHVREDEWVGNYRNTVKYNNVPLFKEYKRGSEVLCTLDKGTSVRILSKIDDVMKVKVNGTVGYIFSEHVMSGCSDEEVKESWKYLGFAALNYKYYEDAIDSYTKGDEYVGYNVLGEDRWFFWYSGPHGGGYLLSTGF